MFLKKEYSFQGNLLRKGRFEGMKGATKDAVV